LKHLLLSTLLFLFLSSSYVSATHMHSTDSHHQDNCDICVIINNFHSGDISLLSFVIDAIEYNYECIQLNESFYIYQIFKGFNSTAPPSF